MTPLRSGPVSGPPVAGDWDRGRLELGLDHLRGGSWTRVDAGQRSWLAPGRVGTEVLAEVGAGDEPGCPDHDGVGTREWQPASESRDRLGQPSGSDGWRVRTRQGSLTRTVSSLSGAVRIGYRVVSGLPWHHRVVLPLRAGPGAVQTHGGPGELVEVSGWAHAWVQDGEDALGLHWTTDQRPDLELLGLHTEPGEDGPVLAPMIGSARTPVRPRRDFSWRLVLTAWRR